MVKNFLLPGDKFMPEMHLKQWRFTYSACGPFTKRKNSKIKEKQKIKNIFTEMNQIKLVFNVMAYGNFKDLATRTDFDKV